MKKFFVILAALAISAPAYAQYENTTRGMKLISDSVAQNGTWNLGTATVGTLTVSTSILLPDGSAASPALSFASDPDTGIYSGGSGYLGVATNGTAGVLLGLGSVISLNNGGYFGWSTARFYWVGNDTVELRRGTSPQKFEVAGTWTDASNYERGYISAGATGTIIGHESAGTGTARAVRVQSSSVTNALFSGKAQAVADATATTVLNVTVPTDGSCSLLLAFSAKTQSAAESQVHNGIVAFAAYEDPDAVDSFACTVSEETEHILASAGTYTDTWTCTAAATTAIKENIDSSLDTATTLNLNVIQNSGCVLSVP
jgi:hypothetical protein